MSGPEKDTADEASRSEQDEPAPEAECPRDLLDQMGGISGLIYLVAAASCVFVPVSTTGRA